MGRYTKREYRLGAYWLGQRSGSVAWYRCWLDGDRTKRASLGTDDHEVAKAKLNEWFVLNHAPQNEKPAGVIMRDVLARYVAAKTAAVSHATIALHARTWNKRFADKTVDEACSFAAQEAFKTSLVEQSLAVQTINNIISVGRAAVRQAWKRGEITHVPPFSTLPAEEQEPMGRPLEPREVFDLVSGPIDVHVQILLRLCLGTAARPSALLDLDWKQVNFHADLIHLNAPGRRQNKKHRPTLKMPPSLRQFLFRHRQPAGPVVQWKGKPVKSIRTSWRRYREECGLERDATLYSFRHTLSRWMRSQGVPTDQIQAQLGHRTLGVTERYVRYVEYAPDYLAQSTAAIDSFMQEVWRVGGANLDALPVSGIALVDDPMHPPPL